MICTYGAFCFYIAISRYWYIEYGTISLVQSIGFELAPKVGTAVYDITYTSDVELYRYTPEYRAPGSHSFFQCWMVPKSEESAREG